MTLSSRQRAPTTVAKPRLLVSACLIGDPVRFDGGHRRSECVTSLGAHVELVPVCPEVEAGLGTPRPSMRLVFDRRLRMLNSHGIDVTDSVAGACAGLAEQADDVDGALLKKGSPSCGPERVKTYAVSGMPLQSGSGLFARALLARSPHLPIEDEGRLQDPGLRDSFFARLFAHARLRQLFGERFSTGRLVEFHARHKLLLMAHSPSGYGALGRMVACARALEVADLRRAYVSGFMNALARPVTVGRHANVLEHVAGYVRPLLDRSSRKEIQQLIADFRRGLLPLAAPQAVLRHHVRSRRIPYIEQQVYLEPYPREIDSVRYPRTHEIWLSPVALLRERPAAHHARSPAFLRGRRARARVVATYTAGMVDRTLVLDAVQTLVRVPSVNPTIAPGEGKGEQAVATVARQWLQAHGIAATLEEAAPGRPNCVAQVGGSDGPTLVFCAHLDTVGTAGMTIPPFEPTIENGRLYGRGSYDMKGSAGAIMAAAVSLAKVPIRGRVLLALVADEEDASAGAVDFVARHRADACIVTEPSEGSLVLAHKGFVWLEVTTRGVAAHGSRWDLGVSAIGRMAELIVAIERFDRDVLRARTHPLVGPASLHCALIEGGSGWSTYAPECRVKIERRTIPGEEPRQVVQELASVIRETGIDAEIRVVFDRPPLVSDPREPIVQCVRDAVTEQSGSRPNEIGVAYWMDAAIFAAAGIPTVNYGPAGEGAHAAVEWVDLDSVVLTAHVLVDSARRFCGQ